MSDAQEMTQDLMDYLEGTLFEMYHEFEAHKRMRFECSHEDSELEGTVYQQTGEEMDYFESEDVTKEERDKYEEIYNKYYEDLQVMLDETEDFTSAEMNPYFEGDEDFFEIIKEGAYMERTLAALKSINNTKE
jgi:beta-galactosidase beta subunit